MCAFLLVLCGTAPVLGSRIVLVASRRRQQAAEPLILRPTVLAASHNLTGYAPDRAVDGNPSTYWLVPGGQRMEKMSRDKWLVLDLGRPAVPSALTIRGVVSTLGGARICLDRGESPSGPWRRVTTLRGLRGLRTPVQCDLPASLPPTRYFRLYIRREGHATFRHVIHDLSFTCRRPEADAGLVG